MIPAAEVVNEDEHERGSVSEMNSSGGHRNCPVQVARL